MLDYGFFYDIAEYGNENWKGSFTPKEIAENAYEYLCEFRYSKATAKVTHVIQELLRLLETDGSETALEYAKMLRMYIEMEGKICL